MGRPIEADVDAAVLAGTTAAILIARGRVISAIRVVEKRAPAEEGLRGRLAALEQVVGRDARRSARPGQLSMSSPRSTRPVKRVCVFSGAG